MTNYAKLKKYRPDLIVISGRTYDFNKIKDQPPISEREKTTAFCRGQNPETFFERERREHEQEVIRSCQAFSKESMDKRIQAKVSRCLALYLRHLADKLSK